MRQVVVDPGDEIDLALGLGIMGFGRVVAVLDQHHVWDGAAHDRPTLLDGDVDGPEHAVIAHHARDLVRQPRPC